MGNPVSRVQSIDRAFDVLGALSGGPLGVTDVAMRVGLPKSTVARLLAALVDQGAVEQVPDGTDYRIGDRLVTLAAGVRPTRSLIALARPHLVQLAGAIGEATGLSIPDGGQVHYIDQEDSPHPVSIRDWTGTRLPMHAVSSGIVILAALPPAEVDRILTGPLERFTDATETDPDRVRQRIRRARIDGCAWTRDEVADGITSVAAAIAGEAGSVVGAIHVHGPSYRFPDAVATPRAEIEARLIATAAAISASLRRAA
jgi:DNA-binding IclR family transcriptional regulator